MSKVAVFGAGSWGTAFSIVLADAGNDVTLWARREELCAAINEQRENTDYLPGIELPPAIVGDPRPREGAARRRRRRARRAVAVAARQPHEQWRRTSADDAVMVSLMKGVELGTLKRMSEVIAEVTGAGPERIAVVSGPNLAKEIARREPAASRGRLRGRGGRQAAAGALPLAGVPALHQRRRARLRARRRLQERRRASRSAWPSGSGFGDNTTASVITRGLAETARLAMALGANPLTLMGLAGLGDLVATCSSPLSRNRTFGEKLGQGMSAEEIYASTRQVAEGAKSCSSHPRPRRERRRRRPDRRARRRGGRRPDDRHRDDGRLHRPRHQGRDGLTSRRSRYARPRSSTRLVDNGRSAVSQVGPEVVDVLDADGQPHQGVGDGGGLGLPAAAPLERRLDAAQRGRVHPEPGRVGEQVGGRSRRRPVRRRRSPPKPG